MHTQQPSYQDVFDKKKLETFTKQLQSETFISFLQNRIAYPVSDIRQEYYNYIEQAAFGVQLLSRFDLTGKRILEVGSGAGILTAWLLLNDIDVIGIEPGALGFHFHQDIFTAIWDYFELPADKVFDKTAEQIAESELGRFDLIFSVNVMEHIPVPNIELVFQKMKSVLQPNGIMYHHCPNYTIPYEPHYGLPLIPFFPQAVGKLTGKSREALWQSVNFITLSQVRKIASKNAMKVYFEKGIMAESFNRLQHDEEFAFRHPVLTKLSKVMKRLGILKAMKALPPELCTPMTFIISDKAHEVNMEGFN